MNVVQSLCRFADALEQLLAAPDAAAFECVWDALRVDRLAWDALALARRADTDAVEPALAQVDRRLLAVLERCRAFLDRHLVTFRVPELERWQHAAAAALVGARWDGSTRRSFACWPGAANAKARSRPRSTPARARPSSTPS